MLRLPRRVFLHALLLEGAAGVIASSGLSACTSADEAARDDGRLAVLKAYFGGKLVEAARIGRAALAGGALEAAGRTGTVEDTARAIAGAVDPERALAELDAKVEAELAEGSVVEVAGWISSPTEVALCVLASRHLDG